VARGNITKAGNARARRVLVEGAWTYRLPARMGEDITRRNDGLPGTLSSSPRWEQASRLHGEYIGPTVNGDCDLSKRGRDTRFGIVVAISFGIGLIVELLVSLLGFIRH
jgi:hypothetical protein